MDHHDLRTTIASYCGKILESVKFCILDKHVANFFFFSSSTHTILVTDPLISHRFPNHQSCRLPLVSHPLRQVYCYFSNTKKKKLYPPSFLHTSFKYEYKTILKRKSQRISHQKTQRIRSSSY